ncbi:hypothetical protein LC653_44190 [Nostoc sp. CHAB 5784]|uniref:hypothetical protein n=1 Tax=Nostoc mirabile TaxID=2907820 RepID=UPI001E4093D1|nr:hypothetical protein [Nostoc mirabile]MCC5670591.1 hypothetical protein [Nostoc mirabile CHAB5784]
MPSITVSSCLLVEGCTGVEKDQPHPKFCIATVSVIEDEEGCIFLAISGDRPFQLVSS